tara:strand:- start:776 stop:979 length:204 start_codon:yes stop_codon:yes gene_type:complete
MNVKINIVELASKLAHRKLKENWNEVEDIYQEHYEEYVGLRYTDEAQKKFDMYYNMFWDLINSSKTV